MGKQFNSYKLNADNINDAVIEFQQKYKNYDQQEIIKVHKVFPSFINAENSIKNNNEIFNTIYLVPYKENGNTKYAIIEVK